MKVGALVKPFRHFIVFMALTVFTNLISVKWVQGDCLTSPPYLFDNVVLNEPLAADSGTRPNGNAWAHHKEGDPYANPFGRK